MAKALKIVGTVVAVVAIVASAGAALAPVLAGTAGTAAAASATILGISAATLGTIGAVASIAAAALAVVSALAFKPKFSAEGSPTRFTTNPQSGIPYCIGRTRQSGVRIHADTWNGTWSDDGKNDILGFAVMLSGGGEIDAIEKFTADGNTVTFDPLNGVANSSEYSGWMAQKVWKGGPQTSALALTFGGAGFKGWTYAHKLSGITHALWSLRFDFDGKKYGAGVPEPAWIGRWVKVYDPRLDSTYPGGSGTCRPLQEATYVWSRNPALHGLTWALGRWQNGKKVFGIGAPFNTIRVADFVEAANVADANKWYCGGVEYSTESKWTALKRMLQAGGATPTMTGAMIGCRVYTPRVSVTTIQADDLLDGLSFAATKPQRDRFNTVIPRYRSEAHEWEIISGTPVSAAAYVAADGRVRQKEYDLPLVQHEVGQTNVDGNRQAGQLAAYEIVESREAGPISFTTGPKFLGLKAGDCVNLNAPAEGFANTKVMIIEPPKLDPASGKISFLGQTETDAKHTYALGQVTTPPPSFSLTPPDLVPTTPASDQWSVSALNNADGIPVLKVAGGTTGGGFWNGVVVQYKRTSDLEWIEYGVYRDTDALNVEILVDGETQYQVRLAYLGASNIVSDWLTLSSVTTPAASLSINNATVFLFQRTTTSTPPSVPSTTSTYNFTTGVLTGFNNGWSVSLPTTGGAYRWMIRATAISNSDTDTILTGEWSSPSIMAENGADGADGTNGTNVATVYLYRRSATSPTLPSGTFTFTFATGLLSGGTLNGWTQAVPAANGLPLWIIGAVASANTPTDTIAAAEFTTPVIDSGAGLNNATVELFQRAASAPAVPATDTTYTFSTGVLSGILGSWTQSVPSGTNPLYTTQAVAISTSATDTILSSEWSSPTIMAENGINGVNNAVVYLYKRSATTPTGPSGTFTYAFSTGILSGGTLNGWSQTIPASDSNSLYVITALASANTPTDTITAAEFTSPVIYNNDSLAYTTATNFNARNDRNSSAITAPTIAIDGTAVDHTMNTDGSADISFEWVWGGTNSDIDFWEIMEVGRTSSSAYTVGTSPSIEQRYYLPSERRVYFARGVASDLYWTYAVRAVRVVDPDINSSGYVYSSWVQPTLASEAPFRPSATVPFIGDISGTVGYAPLVSQPNYTVDIVRLWGTANTIYRTKTFKLARFKGSTDVSSSTTWAVSATYSITATVGSTGIVTITAPSSADGFAIINSTYEGITISHIVSVNSSMPPPPITPGRSQFIGPAFGYNDVNTTEVDISSVFSAKTGSTGSFSLRYAGAFSKLNSEAANPANFAGAVLLYVRPVGGTFAQVDNYSFTTGAYIHDEAPVFGLSYRSKDVTGLTANTDYEFKLTALKATGQASGAIVGKGLFIEGY